MVVHFRPYRISIAQISLQLSKMVGRLAVSFAYRKQKQAVSLTIVDVKVKGHQFDAVFVFHVFHFVR